VESVHEFKPEGDEQRHAQQKIGQDRPGMNDGEIADKLRPGPAGAGQDNDKQEYGGELAG
jgi:hypothetical protein